MYWNQQFLTIRSRRRGFHLITREIIEHIDLSKIEIGMLNVFLMHTSASLTINENADPDVRVDLETATNHIAPETLPFVHTMEGPDDMPAHVKCSVYGCSLNIPVHNGHLALGTWQGIYLCEHRDHATNRRIILTAQGRET